MLRSNATTLCFLASLLTLNNTISELVDCFESSCCHIERGHMRFRTEELSCTGFSMMDSSSLALKSVDWSSLKQFTNM
ncbi:MAG: hypothetical protein MHMPM18_000908 [Marteilia pararefringens]